MLYGAATRAILIFLVCVPLSGFAQDAEMEEALTKAEDTALRRAKAKPSLSDEADANNPLADFTAFNIQNYYIPKLTGPIDETANNFILRYAKPLGKWLMRASLPFSRVPDASGTSVSGMGDTDAFFAYLFDTGNPARSFGIGPEVVVPTGTKDETGSDKWQLGAAAVYFDGTSTFFQWGGLLTYRTDVAGDSNRPDVSLFAAQPFYFFQLGGGNYLRGAPIWVFDFENDTYHVPVGLGFGKVIKVNKTVYNFFVEPQFTVLSKGPGQPEFQIYAALNMQFK
jgi:hypothetical protein